MTVTQAVTRKMFNIPLCTPLPAREKKFSISQVHIFLGLLLDKLCETVTTSKNHANKKCSYLLSSYVIS